MKSKLPLILAALTALTLPWTAATSRAEGLTLSRDGHWLVIRGPRVPAGELRVNYLEAYCRANSTDADWVEHTMIAHTNRLISLSPDGKSMELEDLLADGLLVNHRIRAKEDEVEFSLTARNPTTKRSEAHWAQACVRLGPFTGFSPDLTQGDLDDYIGQCFIFVEGELTRLPTKPWATKGYYTPGQVWCPANVPRTDVNPRPLSSIVASNGLIGCFSADGKMIFATAWEPYQELFQGVGRCLHSDFRLGGIEPGKTHQVKGKIYIVPNDVKALLARYQKDFPEHSRK